MVSRRLLPAIRDADLVVLNSAWTVHNAYVGRAARRLGIPYVAAPRGAYDPAILERRRLLKRAWWSLEERRLVQRSRAVHVFFERRSAHIRALGYTGDLVVAPNGVRVPEGFQWQRGGDHLLYLGRYDPEHKGLDLLLQALALAGDDVPPLHMHGSDWMGGKDEVVRARRVAWGSEDRVVIGGHLRGDEKWAAFVAGQGLRLPVAVGGVRQLDRGGGRARRAHVGHALPAGQPSRRAGWGGAGGRPIRRPWPRACARSWARRPRPSAIVRRSA